MTGRSLECETCIKQPVRAHGSCLDRFERNTRAIAPQIEARPDQTFAFIKRLNKL
jgi:hypothetical protein